MYKGSSKGSSKIIIAIGFFSLLLALVFFNNDNLLNNFSKDGYNNLLAVDTGSCTPGTWGYSPTCSSCAPGTYCPGGPKEPKCCPAGYSSSPHSSYKENGTCYVCKGLEDHCYIWKRAKMNSVGPNMGIYDLVAMPNSSFDKIPSGYLEFMGVADTSNPPEGGKTSTYKNGCIKEAPACYKLANGDYYWGTYSKHDGENYWDYNSKNIHGIVALLDNITKEEDCGEKKYACYANAESLADATQAKWLTAPTSKLKYQVTIGIDGKTEITEENHTKQCKVNVIKYCYADAESLDDATKAELLSKPTEELKYLIKDKDGNGITDKDACVVSACYKNNSTNKYQWAKIGSLDSTKYTKVDILKAECINYESCLAKPNKDDYSDYKWVESKNEIDELLNEGYVEIKEIKDSKACVDGGCYQNNNDESDIKWVGGGEIPPVGYTKVESNMCFTKHEQEKCYAYILADGTTKYEWGLSSNGYQLLDLTEELCVSKPKCYLNKKDGTYHTGDYSINSDYTLADDENCITVPAPKTAFNKSTIIYIAVFFLAVSGIGLMYYGEYKERGQN